MQSNLLKINVMKYPLSEKQAQKHLQEKFDESASSFVKIDYSDVCPDDETLQLVMNGWISKVNGLKVVGNTVEGQIEFPDGIEYQSFEFYGSIIIIDDESNLMATLK